MIIRKIKLVRFPDQDNEVIYDFSDDNALTTQVVINQAEFTGDLRTDIKNNNVKNWWIVWNSFWSPRLFTFRWQVFWWTQEKLKIWQENLKRALAPWVDLQDWYNLKLLFTLDDNLEYFTYVQPYKLPNFTKTDEQLIINFEFDLVSDRFEYALNDPQSFTLELTWSTTSRWFTATTDWTWLTPVSIKLTTSVWLVNPKIKNLVTWNYYKLNYTILGWSELVVNFIPNWDPLIYITSGAVLKFYRASWSTSLYLINWDNDFEITTDSDMWTCSMTIEYNSYFI